MFLEISAFGIEDSSVIEITVVLKPPFRESQCINKGQ